MSEWICIHCGVTMSSKCPGQRSTFFGMENSMIRNALATHVINVADSHKEVFLNLSYWGDGDPVLGTIDQLVEWRDKLAAVTCDHHFILNSETQTECRMGCTHYNLKDKERLLAEAKPSEDKKVTFESLKEEYIDYLGTQINLAKENLKRLCPDIRQAYPTYNRYRRWYFVFQDEMDKLKYDLQNGLARLAEGQPYQKTYSVDFGWDSEIPHLYTDDILQAEAVYKYYQSQGVKCSINILTHDKKDSTSIHYRRLEMDPDMRLKCCHCGERINDGEKLIAAEPIEEDFMGTEKQVRPRGLVMHAKCKRAIDYDRTEHRARIVITMTPEELTTFEAAPEWKIETTMAKILRNRLESDSSRYMRVLDCFEHFTKKGGTRPDKMTVVFHAYGADIKALKALNKTINKKETK